MSILGYVFLGYVFLGSVFLGPVRGMHIKNPVDNKNCFYFDNISGPKSQTRTSMKNKSRVLSLDTAGLHCTVQVPYYTYNHQRAQFFSLRLHLAECGS
jgi:hypothetical protein